MAHPNKLRALVELMQANVSAHLEPGSPIDADEILTRLIFLLDCPAQREAFAEDTAQSADADPNAPWLSDAHALCADQGIPPGNISLRLAVLRQWLKVRVPKAITACVMRHEDPTAYCLMAAFKTEAEAKTVLELVDHIADARKLVEEGQAVIAACETFAQVAEAEDVASTDDALGVQSAIAASIRRAGLSHPKSIEAAAQAEPVAQLSAQPVAWAVYWGVGGVRKHSVHFEKSTAEEMASCIKSCYTEVRPLYATPQPVEVQPVATRQHGSDYLGGVNVDNLEAALTQLGYSTCGREEMAARMADYVNRITGAVVKHRDFLRSESPQPVALPHDLFSHKNAWRNALNLAVKNAAPRTEDMDDPAYWMHEVRSFDRVYSQLEAIKSAQPEALKGVRAAITKYYADLDQRKHGGIAQNQAFEQIQQALGMTWVQGASAKGGA